MRKILFLCLSLALCLRASAQFSGSGSGTQSDPYLIFNPVQLNQLQNFCGQEGVYFKLMSDIDVAEFLTDENPTQGWMPIGTEAQPFQGVFDGNNHTVSGLFINRTSDYTGFFGSAIGATVKNLTLEFTGVAGGNSTGAFAGLFKGGSVTNCQVALSQTISGTGHVGGFIGHLWGSTVTSCSIQAASLSATGNNAGGFAGTVDGGTITSCSAELTEVAGGGSYWYGGFAGFVQLSATLNQISAKTNLKGTNHIGGLVGQLSDNSTITEGSHIGTVTSSGGYCGGIVGSMTTNSSTTSCTHYGNISSNSYTGGVAGRIVSSRIVNCGTNGDIKGSNYVGGLVGSFELTLPAPSSLIGSYSVGNINATGDQVGGLVGRRMYNGNATEEGILTEETFLNSLTYKTQDAYSSSDEDEWYQLYYIQLKSYVPDSNIFELDITDYFYCKSREQIQSGNYDKYVYTLGKTSINRKFKAYQTKNISSSAPSIPGYRFLCKSPASLYLWHGESYYKNIYLYIYYAYDAQSSTIQDNYHSGTVKGRKDVGGLIGEANGYTVIERNYAYGSVNGQENVGGAVGRISTSQDYENNNTYQVTLNSNVTICPEITAVIGNAGRVYGKKEVEATIGAVGTTSTNKGLTTSKMSVNGSAVTLEDNLQHGQSIGNSSLKYRASYEGIGWSFSTIWENQETESYPYHKQQTAPPVFTTKSVAGDTRIEGNSVDGGKVYVRIGNETYETNASGNTWSVDVPALQAGTDISIWAKTDGKDYSYRNVQTVKFAGTGTEADPYRIYSEADLSGINSYAHYKLMNDIALTKAWTPLGRSSTVMSHFDGNGKTISNFFTTNTGEDYSGLFAMTDAVEIKDLTLQIAEGKAVKGGDYVGALVGKLGDNSKLTNCKVLGNVTSSKTGTANVGGLVGYAGSGSVLENCTVKGNVTGNAGIVGTSAANITSCFYEGEISSTGETGGLVAANTGNVTGSSAVATINVTAGTGNVGGLIGSNNGGQLAQNSANVTITSASSGMVAGLVAMNSNGNVEQCYTKGSLTGQGNVGGLIAENHGNVTNCFSTVAATTTGEYAAGLIGYNYGAVSLCYASGDLQSSKVAAGVVGYNDGASATINNCVAVNNVIAVTDAGGYGMRVLGGYKNGAPDPTTNNYALKTMSISVNGVTQKIYDDLLNGAAKTIDVLQTNAPYTQLGWDFTNVWKFNAETLTPELRNAQGEAPADVPVSAITLSQTSQSLKVGESVTLTAEVTPEDATNPAVEWTTSDANVATVENGTITAVAAGSATITATATDGSGISASCAVTVTAEEQGGGEGGGESGGVFDDPALNPGNYDNVIYVDNFETKAGSEIVLPVLMRNTEDIIAFQFDLTLPEGVSFKLDSRGRPVVKLNYTRTYEGDHTLSSRIQDSGALRVAVYSTENYAFEGLEGPVAEVTLVVDENMESGEYPIQFSTIEMTKSDAQTYFRVSKVVSKMTIPSYTIGDVNGDGEISVTDVAGVVSFVLGNNSESLIREAADIVADGEITISDVAGVVNMLLAASGSASSSARHTLAVGARTMPNFDIYVAPFTIAPGETKDIEVCLRNPGKLVTGLQLDVTLPEGLEFAKNSRGKYIISCAERAWDHVTNAALQGDGSVRFLIYSNNNSEFDYEEGAVMKLRVKASNSMPAGVYTLTAKNLEGALTSIEAVRPAANSTSIICGNPDEASVSLTGYYEAAELADFAAALTSEKITGVDFSNAYIMDESKTFEVTNPNALIYLNADQGLANTKNLVVGTSCDNLVLVDGHDFTAEKDFTATAASYTRSMTANGWFSLCVPFEVTTFPMNTTVYDVVSIDESAQRVAIAATSMIGADSPVIFNWAGNSGEFKLNVSNAAVKTTSSASLTNGLLSGTYLNGEAGSLSGKYGLRADGTGFGRCTATAYGVPFRAFLNTISPASFISIYDPITGIGFIENDNEKTSGYDLLGRPVSNPTQGIFIINGKKEIIK